MAGTAGTAGTAGAVDDAGDDLVHVVGDPRVGGDHVVQRLRGLLGFDGGLDVPRPLRPGTEGGGDVAHDAECVAVVLGEMVGHTRDLRVQVAAAEFLCGDHLTGRSLHERGAAEEDGALVPDDDGFVAHRGHVGAAGGARPEHRGDLRNALGAHRRLVVEDAAEVLAVREDLVLPGKERAAGVDEVEAGQVVLQRHLLRPQVLLHRDGVVRAALDGRVVGDDHAFATGHPADSGDDAGAGALVAVHAGGGER